MKKERYLILVLFAVTASAVAVSWVRKGAVGQDQPGAGGLGDKVQAELDAVGDSDEDVWRAARKLEALGMAATPDLLAARAGLAPGKELAVCVALSKLGHGRDAVKRIFAVFEASADSAGKTLAADCLGAALASAGPTNEDAERIEKILDSTFDPGVKVALCRVLGERWGSTRAKKELKALLESDEEDVRIRAALALAGIGDVEPGRRILRSLESEPSPRGRLARSLLREYDLHRILERSQTGGKGKQKFDDVVLEEIRNQVLTSYVDPSKAAFMQMSRAAAEGIVLALDPDCAFLDEKDIEKINLVQAGEFTGVGMSVGINPKKPEDEDARRVPVVVATLLNGPAALAGIKPMQEIWDVDGESTIGKNIAEVEAMLAGKPGSKVTITLYHRTWFRERKLTLVRAKVETPETLAESLPLGIFVIKSPQMSMETGKALAERVAAAQAAGAKAIILDLRDNPGGPRECIAGAASAFLVKGTPVFLTRGRNKELVPDAEHLAGDGPACGLPLVVLVNEGTAGSAEILAGALNDAGRATLVGVNTFGQAGITQTILLKTLSSRAGVRLTVGTCLLPKSGAFHGKGVSPKKTVQESRTEIWRHDEIYKVIEAGHVARYLDERMSKNPDLFRELARKDGGDIARWPDFEEWFRSTGTKAERDDLRNLLRAEVRRRLGSNGGTPLVTDLQEDVQMRAALAIAASLAEVKLSGHPDYEGIESDK